MSHEIFFASRADEQHIWMILPLNSYKNSLATGPLTLSILGLFYFEITFVESNGLYFAHAHWSF